MGTEYLEFVAEIIGSEPIGTFDRSFELVQNQSRFIALPFIDEPKIVRVIDITRRKEIREIELGLW